MDEPPPSLPAALLFDMDGTLTEPMLDFPRIKAEMGIGNQPILEALALLEPDARKIAEAILLRHEEHAAQNSTLNLGCRELIEWVCGKGIGTALITRNSRLSVTTVLERHGLDFDVLVTREDGPFKPDPYPLRLACERLKIGAADAWMVGDGQYDVEAGNSAGIATIWVSHGRQRPFAAVPWRQMPDLSELLRFLQAAAGDERRVANSQRQGQDAP